MSRLSELQPADLSPEQRQVYDNIVSGPRGAVGGPFNAMLRTPAIADPAQELGASIRFRGSLPGSLRELAILVTARKWTAQYEWYAHSRIARTEGVPEAMIQAIAARERPAFPDSETETVFELCTALLDSGQVDDDLYATALERFGEEGVMELVGIVGYYTLVSFTLNTFQVPVPWGENPLV